MLHNHSHRRSIRLKEYDYSQEGLYFVTICVQDRVCLFGKVVEATSPPQGEGKCMVLNEFGRIAQNELLKTNQIRPNVEIDSFVVMPNHVHFIVRIMCDAVGRGELHSPEFSNAEFHSPEIQNTEFHSPEIINAEFHSSENENGNIKEGECNSPVQMDFSNDLNGFFQEGECNSSIKHDICNSKKQECEYNSFIQQDECDSSNQKGECNSFIKHDECDSSNQKGECNSPLRGTSQTVGAIVRGYKSSVTKQLIAMGFIGKLWQRNYYEHIIRTPESHDRIANYIEDNPARWDEDKFYKR